VTELAQAAVDPSRALGADREQAGAERWRRPPLWLWGAAVVAQVLAAAALTRSAFFFLDDYVFLNQARQQSFGVGYLRGALYEHFSPISRLLDKLLVVVAPGSFVFTHCVELALYAGALLAFIVLIRTLLGNSWGAFAFTVLFGQSVFLIRLLFWWTATANILPATVFSLLAIACYVGWRERRSRALAVGSVLAYGAALLDYETAMLLPLYIALISLLVLERQPGPRAWLASLWRERWLWLVYVVMDIAALVNYYSFYYYRKTKHPPFGALMHFMEIALFQTFMPGVVGIQYAKASFGSHLFANLAAIAVVVAAVAVTCYLRPRAWRCLLAFAIVFLVTMLPVGLNRIVHYGLRDAYVLYYQQAVQLMFLVLAAFAVSPRWSGRRPPAAVGRRRPSRRLLGAGAVAAAALYAALYLSSLHALINTTWEASADRSYLSAYLASVKRVKQATGREPVLDDLAVSARLLPVALRPYDTYGEFFALFNHQLRVDQIADPVYVVSSSGRLQPLALTATTGGSLARATVSPVGRPAVVAAAAPRGGAIACVPAGAPLSWLRVPLARPEPIRGQASGLRYALRATYSVPATVVAVAMQLLAPGARRIATVTSTWDRGSGGELLPLNHAGDLRGLEFRLPARSCISTLAVGRLERPS
jgi:hypothetical protein